MCSTFSTNMPIKEEINGGKLCDRMDRSHMKTARVERIKQQCEDQNTSFFFKQWGGWGDDGIKRSKKANGRLLLGRTWDSMPDLLRPSYVSC